MISITPWGSLFFRHYQIADAMKVSSNNRSVALYSITLASFLSFKLDVFLSFTLDLVFVFCIFGENLRCLFDIIVLTIFITS
jgi:hypothetical protein